MHEDAVPPGLETPVGELGERLADKQRGAQLSGFVPGQLLARDPLICDWVPTFESGCVSDNDRQ